ncbi:contact-dependent growth inhibition system immunity protein [Agromyces sp. MMS24-JH15]|uniref:contact-dependent growth inhibition system immunity protein n=1 Tax=Agromyces sp. MMS24-JH15 TaxID=3243765 RepID=UPI003748F28E
MCVDLANTSSMEPPSSRGRRARAGQAPSSVLHNHEGRYPMSRLQPANEVEYLAQAYFHQDFEYEADDPIGVVRKFRDEEAATLSERLRNRLESILGDAPSESDLATLWLDQAGASYDPARMASACTFGFAACSMSSPDGPVRVSAARWNTRMKSQAR